MKICNKCKKKKDLSEFATNRDRNGNARPYSICKACVRLKNKKIYEDNSEAIKAKAASRRAGNPSNASEIQWKWRLRQHGIDESRYYLMLESQGGMCAICLESSDIRLHVDHDHNHCPGKYGCNDCIRGLLCSQCNLGIGLLKDNGDNLIRAAGYLANWKE